MTLRGVIVSFIMTIVLSIMVLGYAALQQRIDIEAEATVDSTYKVQINSVKEKSATGDARSTSVFQYNGLSTTFHVGLTNETDSITYEIELNNLGTVDAILNNTEMLIDGSNNIKVVKSGIRNGDILLANSIKVLTIKVGLTQSTSSEQTANITINLDYTRLKGGSGEVQEDNYYSIIPSDYQECDYLETDGNAYFDTGIIPDGTLIIQTKFRTNSIKNIFIGTRSNSPDAGAVEGINYRLFQFSNNFYFDIGYGKNGGNNRIVSNSIVNANTIYEIEFGNRYIKDITTDSIIASNTELNISKFGYTQEYGIKIFSQMPRSTSSNNVVGQRIYYLKMYQSIKLVRDFIPVLDDNGVPCLYDTVTGDTFYNQGTGDFLYQLKE